MLPHKHSIFSLIFRLTVSFCRNTLFRYVPRLRLIKRRDDKLGLDLRCFNWSYYNTSTSTCFMYNSSHYQNNYSFIELCFFKCKLVNETCAIALVQAGTQADQLAGTIDWVGNITNFTKNRTRKSAFFSQNSIETCSLIFVSAIKKVYQENIPFVKTIDMYDFIKDIIGKTNCYLHAHFFFDLY